MALTINDTTAKNAQLTALSTSVGAGGTLTFRSSTPTTLAILTGATFGSPSGGSMSVTATADSSVDATGTANDVQIKTSGGTVIATVPIGDITITGSITASGSLTLTSFTITA